MRRIVGLALVVNVGHVLSATLLLINLSCPGTMLLACFTLSVVQIPTDTTVQENICQRGDNSDFWHRDNTLIIGFPPLSGLFRKNISKIMTVVCASIMTNDGCEHVLFRIRVRLIFYVWTDVQDMRVTHVILLLDEIEPPAIIKNLIEALQMDDKIGRRLVERATILSTRVLMVLFAAPPAFNNA
eukprot:XP_001707987.1 Hypothetical protein GL50803_36235 [Giardia lamblia ATCC 50803]